MRREKQSAINFVKGFVIGSSDIVPGVSGGTMALILGVYEKLIGEISNISRRGANLFRGGSLKSLVRSVDWRFLVPLLIGVGSAIIVLSRPLDYALQTEPMFIWAFFFGLVAGSVYFVGRRVRSMRHSMWFVGILGFVLAYLVVGIIPIETAATPLLFMFSGAIGIAATMLPGVSGSFLLLIIGKYGQIITAIHTWDVRTLAFFGVGVCLGLFLFSRLIGWLLEHYHDWAIIFLVGLMTGSLRKIWPWKLGEANVFPVAIDRSVVLVLILAIIGYMTVFYLEKLSRVASYKK